MSSNSPLTLGLMRVPAARFQATRGAVTTRGGFKAADCLAGTVLAKNLG